MALVELYRGPFPSQKPKAGWLKRADSKYYSSWFFKARAKQKDQILYAAIGIASTSPNTGGDWFK